MLRQPRTLEAHRSSEAKRPLVAFARQIERMPALADEAHDALALLQADA